MYFLWMVRIKLEFLFECLVLLSILKIEKFYMKVGRIGCILLSGV
jgi:hypothetical protein